MTLMRMTQFPPTWRELDELFRDLRPVATEDRRTLAPAADIVDTGPAVEIHLDLPGVDPEGIEVKLDSQVLTISAQRPLARPADGKGVLRAERPTGTFTRSFTIPTTLDGSRPEATYRHGVLVVTLPKKEEVQPRSFKVKVEA